jgi:3-hydroxyacyl-CoA dehydrogenase / enoyl-CoA hydratase / 3-hydroxybutyryl-CoA epimerase
MSDLLPESQTSLEFQPPREPFVHMSTAGVRLEVDEQGVGWVLFDHPTKPVNVLDTPTMETLRLVLDEAMRKDVAGLVFASDKPGMFLAGADVDEITAVTDARMGAEKAAYGQAVFERIAGFGKPTVSVITGPCLGGGYELALATSLCIAENTPKVRIGLPEVQLGLLPGFGGTQRLPRRAGLMTALDVILAGKTLPARPAVKRGLVDVMVPEGLGRLLAREFVTGQRAFETKRPGWLDKVARALPPVRARIFRQAESQLSRKVRRDHYPAPYLALESIANGLSLEEVAAYRQEALLLGEALATETCRSLLWLFQASQRAKEPPGIDTRVGKRVERLGIVGAGIMGGGIAWLSAEKQLPTRVKDIAPSALETALRTAAGLWDTAVQKRRMTPREREARVEALSFGLDLSGFGMIDLAIEAVVEDVAIKRRVIAELEDVVSPATVIATNTSSLRVADLAVNARHPERIVGLHFFNPVHRMPLVEVVIGSQSSPEAVTTAFRLARDLGKTPVLVRDGPGFLVNRLLAFYLGEAINAFEQGADPVLVDTTMVEFGMPMGPFELLDQIGLDVANKVTHVLGEAFGDRLPRQVSIGRLIESGALGKKSGRGFYVYREGTKGSLNEEARVAAGNPAPHTPPGQEIMDRLLLPMVHEGARALEEGLVRDAEDIDLAMVLGTGFPAFRRGPLFYADRRGIPAVISRLEDLAASHGVRLAPSEALRCRNAGFYGH